MINNFEVMSFYWRSRLSKIYIVLSKFTKLLNEYYVTFYVQLDVHPLNRSHCDCDFPLSTDTDVVRRIARTKRLCQSPVGYALILCETETLPNTTEVYVVNLGNIV